MADADVELICELLDDNDLDEDDFASAFEVLSALEDWDREMGDGMHQALTQDALSHLYEFELLAHRGGAIDERQVEL